MICDPPQEPKVQTSSLVNWFPSSHSVPSEACGLHSPASWHESRAVQVTSAQRYSPPHSTCCVPEESALTLQTSFTLSESSSSQVEPSALSGSLHSPVKSSQTPTSWHWSLAEQVTPTQSFSPMQTPAPSHLSFFVYPLLSSQLSPDPLKETAQTPVCLSQLPGLWQSLEASQVTSAHLSTPAQDPALHWSSTVTSFPSSQADWSAEVAWKHSSVCQSHCPFS